MIKFVVKVPHCSLSTATIAASANLFSGSNGCIHFLCSFSFFLRVSYQHQPLTFCVCHREIVYRIVYRTYIVLTEKV